MAADRADLVVVGAGTIGGWSSYFARSAGAGRVIVVERGRAGEGASSRAAGIVRAQGGTPTTVALGRWSIDFYRNQQSRLRADSGFRELGYLILAVTDDDVVAGRERVAMQQQAGVDARWVEPGSRSRAASHPLIDRRRHALRASSLLLVHVEPDLRLALRDGDAALRRRHDDGLA